MKPDILVIGLLNLLLLALAGCGSSVDNDLFTAIDNAAFSSASDSTIVGASNQDVSFIYRELYTKYGEVVREVNANQIGVLYANDMAMLSYNMGDIALPGSVLIMEVYERSNTLLFREGVLQEEASTASTRVLPSDVLSFIAVMEKQDPGIAQEPIAADLLLDNWRFAKYTPDGGKDASASNCIGCHIPKAGTDHIFTFTEIKTQGIVKPSLFN